MTEYITIYDTSGNQVYDPEGAIEYATGISWETYWPKGFGTASFRVRRMDVFAGWVVKNSYGVIIWDDGTIVYQGRIESMPITQAGADEYVNVQCVGWWALFEERDLRKRWIDIKGIDNLHWPQGLTTDITQTSFVNTKRDNIIQILLGTRDIYRVRYETYRERYETPTGTIRRVSFDWLIRSGENFFLELINGQNPPGVDHPPTPGVEWYQVSQSAPRSGINQIVTIAYGATSFLEFRALIWNDDLYDNNDYAHISNLRVETNYEAGHRAIAAPTYTQGQLVEDVVLLVNQKGANISTDFTDLGDPGQVLDPYAVEEPTYAAKVIEAIAAYGDTALNTWGASVWDRTGTADGKPRFVFEAKSVSDWEYELNPGEYSLKGLTYEKTSDGLYNSVTVRYTDERGVLMYRTGTDNAALKDMASIDDEYQRDYYLKLDDAAVTVADYVGSRFIEYHKDRLTRATFQVVGEIRKKDGGMLPVSRVRAGQRVKFIKTGEIFFIHYTSYDAESRTINISPDMPVDNIQMYLAQLERKLR